MADRHPGTTHLLDLFEHGHLPAHLAAVSAKCADTAADMAFRLHDGPELSAGLRKLLEAKDCFVRQAVIDKRESDRRFAERESEQAVLDSLRPPRRAGDR